MLTRLGIFVLISSFVACAPDPIEVKRVDDAKEGSFGHPELNAASDELAKSPKSAKAFAAFDKRVRELKPVFAEHIADDAERRLVFAAIEPLAVHYGKPIDEQFEALALTVWPAALRKRPKEGETAWQYAERLCSGPMALDCKYIVREHWPMMLNALVWQRFKERAREAYSVCGQCQKEPTYERILEQYQEYHSKIGARAAVVKPRAHPRQWPYAGDKSEAWPSDVPLLEFLGDGTVVYNGDGVDSSWRQALRERRSSATTLGLHLRPTEDVRQLRAILADIKKAGYKRVALQTRRPKLPYETRTYFLDLDNKPIKVSVRENDSIQVLVQALDIGA